MAFRPGDHVHVVRFGKGVVREVRNGGRYLVDVKGAAMVAAEAQLTLIEEAGRSRAVSPHQTDSAAGLPSRANAASSLDLHGKTTAEATAVLDEFLNDALLAGLAEVRVIHGRSGGRVKAAIEKRLKQLPSVRSFRLDPANPGVTIVSL